MKLNTWRRFEKIIKEYYSVMLHPSSLPKYRGGSPIQNQIINGEKISAVTLFKMNEKIDQGDIIFQKEIELSDVESLETLREKIREAEYYYFPRVIKNLL